MFYEVLANRNYYLNYVKNHSQGNLNCGHEIAAFNKSSCDMVPDHFFNQSMYPNDKSQMKSFYFRFPLMQGVVNLQNIKNVTLRNSLFENNDVGPSLEVN